MEISAIIVFAIAVALGTATPGPTTVTLVARVLASGLRGSLPFGLGLVLGDIVWLACAVFGIAAMATALHDAMVVLKYAGAAYLLYLAYRLWTAPVASEAAPAASLRHGLRALAGGFTLAMANAKTMMFYLALIPNLIEVTRIDAATFAQLSLVLALVYAAVQVGYSLAALRARGFLASPAKRRLMNRGSAVLLSGTAAFVASRS